MRGENICTKLPKGSSLTVGCGAGIKAGLHASPAIPMEAVQADELASVLGWAHYDEPHFRYVMPDAVSRLRLLPGLFRIAMRACQKHGEVHTTQNINAGALWIRPGTNLTVGRMMRTGFPSLQLQWDWASLRRCINIGMQLDKVHGRLIKQQHWYLLALGVRSSHQKESVGANLLEPLLSRADSDGLACYVETFNERDLAFFKRQGFRIAGGGSIPRGGPDFWAMIREPQTTLLK